MFYGVMSCLWYVFFTPPQA